MYNHCPKCESFRQDRNIDPAGPYAICPVCGDRQGFVYAPLLIVSGAGGTGKSTICRTLVGKCGRAILLEGDILWSDEYYQADATQRFLESVLRMAMNISQSGFPVVLFGAGFGVPSNITSCVESRYFSSFHYLALTCERSTLEKRLSSRPSWRSTSQGERMNAQLEYNDWFRLRAPTLGFQMDFIDTTIASTEHTADTVKEWIRAKVEDHF